MTTTSPVAEFATEVGMATRRARRQARAGRPVIDPGSIFRDRAYAEAVRSFATAWARLPIVCHVGGIAVRWIGPLVRLGLDQQLGDMSEAAYGVLEDCQWQSVLETGGEPFVGGRLRAEYARAFARAARALADAGLRAGPESDPEVWAAWLAFEISAMHDCVRRRAAHRGCE